MYWMDLTSSVRCEFLYRSANSLACSSSTSWRVPRDSPRQLTHKRRSASETHMECASWVFQPLLNPATNSLMAASSLLLADSFAEATRAKPIPRAIAKTRIRIASTRLGSSVAAIEALVFILCAPRSVDGFFPKSLTGFVLDSVQARPARMARGNVPPRVHHSGLWSNTCGQGWVRLADHREIQQPIFSRLR